MTLEDEKIVSLYWERNEHAITQTDRKYGSYCRKIAQNILSNTEDSEECVNDTYLHAWNSIPPHKPSALAPFLGKIVRNLSYDRYKHNTAEKRGGGAMPDILDELAEIVSGHEDVEQKIEEKELIRAIDSFLGTLSPKKRSVFIRRYWYTDHVSTIAYEHCMKESAVSMMLKRLRIKLYEHLTERGFTL